MQTFDPELFVHIKIPESIGPLDRCEKYEDPLEERLTETALGEVSGGGSQLGNERPDGTRPIEFCGLDIDVTNLGKALKLLRIELIRLAAPDGTELHYTDGGIRLQDELREGEWHISQPREFLHPGFDC